MASVRLAAIGLFVLIGAALAFATVVVFGRLDLFGETRAAVIVFDGAVNGLGVGSPVTFRGVRVGAVSSVAIAFDPRTHAAHIPVKIQLAQGKILLPKGYRGAMVPMSQWVADGLRAQVVPVSLIADESEIDLDFIPAAPANFHPQLADLPEIPVSRSAGGEIAQELSRLPLRDIADNTIQTLQSVRALADTLGKSLPTVLDSTISTSAKAGQTLDTARTAIEELQIRTDSTLAGIDRLSGSADRQLNDRGADLHDLLSNLNGMTDARSPDRANLDSSLNDLSDASAALRGFANDIEQNPRLLLTGRHP
ncbi:MAG TPA: MlaD family protein [Steroidobacteraceae bacterium]|nr:MlaD family protein [Steroidobacteraceae bacterium]